MPHRPIDAFFEVLAQDQRERAIGVVLSSTASDGTFGLEVIKAEGGITFAQDGSARYDSMPRSAVTAGCVDFVLSPAQIPQELARIVAYPYLARQPASSPPRPKPTRQPRRRTRTTRARCPRAEAKHRPRARSRHGPRPGVGSGPS